MHSHGRDEPRHRHSDHDLVVFLEGAGGDSRALVAVTARSNCQKADQDPSQWLPDDAVICRYVSDWAAIKGRWHLSVDPVEKQTLTDLAADCPNSPVDITPAD